MVRDYINKRGNNQPMLLLRTVGCLWSCLIPSVGPKGINRLSRTNTFLILVSAGMDNYQGQIIKSEGYLYGDTRNF
jgi:hypothetical protein